MWSGKGRGENNLIFERVELELNLKLLSISCSLIRDYVVYEGAWVDTASGGRRVCGEREIERCRRVQTN